jgi:WD40 repeat protein
MVSPSGKLIAAAREDGSIGICDMFSGVTLRVLERHDGGATCVAFHPNGLTLASGGWDNRVRLWETTTGRELLPPKGINSPVYDVAFSPNSNQLAVSTADATVLADLPSFRHHWLLKRQSDSPAALTFSPDGKLLACSSATVRGSISLLDAHNGKEVRSFSATDTRLSAFLFSRDGKSLIAGGADHLIRIWDITVPSQPKVFDSKHRDFSTLTLSPDGKTLATGGSDRKIHIWDFLGSNHRATLNFTADGFPAPSISAIAFSPDQKLLAAAATDSIVRLWDIEKRTLLHQLKGVAFPIVAITFTPDGLALLTGSGTGHLHQWDVRSGKELQRLQGHRGTITQLTFSRDGKVMASASVDNTVLLWDPAKISAGKR